MQGVSRDRDYQRLLRELKGDEYAALLQGLPEPGPSFRRFHDWSDFIAFIRAGTSANALKEEALLAILKAHAADRDPRWRTILLAVFWPSLEAILNRKKRWDADAEERWQNVQWAFLQTVCRLDVNRRTDRLVQRIVSGTIHRLHDEYRRIWDRSGRETATDPGRLEESVGGGEGLDFTGMDLRFKQDVETRRLRRHVEAGRLSEADFLLLVGTRLYGKSAAQYARETGMSADLARKRRLRAEAAIRKAEGRR